MPRRCGFSIFCMTKATATGYLRPNTFNNLPGVIPYLINLDLLQLELSHCYGVTGGTLR